MSEKTIPPMHTRLEQTFGADVRLMYGFGMPLFVGTAAIVALIVTGAGWLLPLVLLVVFALTAGVFVGIMRMLDEEDSSEE